IEGVDLVIPNSDKPRLVSIIHQQLNLPEAESSLIENDSSPLLFSGRQRAFIKVQDGCRYRCTYCIVTLARGEESSRSINDIIDEINILSSQNIKEVVLTGVHLGGYGAGLNSNLAALVKEVLKSTDMQRIRMGSLEPWELHDDFWHLFEDNRVMPHLHLPLQSGANSVLRRMARRCKTEDFAQLLKQARDVNPLFNITTDIIVGFPGETDKEWQQGLSFIEQCNFGHIHIFAFSPREGTKAAILPDPISRDIKRQRSEELHQLAARMKRRNLEKMLEQQTTVLFEGNQQLNPDASITWSGYTPNFQRVKVTTQRNDLCNQVLGVKLEQSLFNDELSGQLIGKSI
ncbi:MAG: MiaB/RimO family radical SAM methylthiotransferase, partial [Gammaproteobacteria bacterium]|nr:MiaB/RimO family radical SAM methylthiotransferase [Gammaproteobacteria bacterium]